MNPGALFRSPLNNQLARLRLLRERAPIFAELQYRSGTAVANWLDAGDVFEEPDTIATLMTSILRRVNLGLEGRGSRSQTYTLPLYSTVPHEANIFFGASIHIPQDIGGGLDDTFRAVHLWPTPIDYRTMYAPVRASMVTVSDDLFMQVGANTTTSSVELLEALIRQTSRDPIQGLRDWQLTRRGGVVASGLPTQEEIERAIAAIRDSSSVSRTVLRF